MPVVPDAPRRILGLDPGLQTTGYGVLEIAPSGPRVAEAGVVRSTVRQRLCRRYGNRIMF